MPIRRRQFSPRDAVDLAVQRFGSETALARKIGIAQQNVNRAIRRGSFSPKFALGVHKATAGLISASWIRPDLWKRRDHVPNGR